MNPLKKKYYAGSRGGSTQTRSCLDPDSHGAAGPTVKLFDTPEEAVEFYVRLYGHEPTLVYEVSPMTFTRVTSIQLTPAS